MTCLPASIFWLSKLPATDLPQSVKINIDIGIGAVLGFGQYGYLRSATCNLPKISLTVCLHVKSLFQHPILNSPYGYPSHHWELDDQGQPTQHIITSRRKAEFITPIPKPQKRKSSAIQIQLIFDEGKGLSTQEQQYDHTAIINAVRQQVDQWRLLPNPQQWQVTPETARLLPPAILC